MFGIGGGEMFLILIIVLMLFGSDKIPEFARAIAKMMAQVKNATNEIKSEITKTVDSSNVVKDIKEAVDVEKIKESVGIEDIKKNLSVDSLNPLKEDVEKIKEDFENQVGPIKRNR